jgi:hypothetical protein
VSVPVEAVSVLSPALVPSVHDPTVAIPEASVATDWPVTEPPPPVTTKVTVTPAIGSLFWSVTRTDGGGDTAVLASAVNDVLVFATIEVGTGGSTPFSPPQAMHANTTAAAVGLNATRADLAVYPTSGPACATQRVLRAVNKIPR